MVAPKPKIDELTDRVNAELLKPRSDEFALMRLERDVSAQLKAQDAAIRTGALALLGVIQALRFDVDGARKYFEQALAASGNDSQVYVNYASMLASFGFAVEALDAIEKAVKKSPQASTIKLALIFASNAFELEKADSYSAWLKRLDVLGADPDVRRAHDAISNYKLLLSRPAVQRSELAKRYELARSIARLHRVRVPEERVTLTIRGVLVHWVVDCDHSEIERMNLEVAERLSQLDPDPCEPLIAFGYTRGSFAELQAWQ